MTISNSDTISIPLWSRASDIRTLALGQGCEGQWYLSHLYRGELPDAVWFILGTAIHTAIEETILHDYTLDEAIEIAHTDRRMMMHDAEANGIIQQTSARAKRGLHTIEDDINRMVKKWWDDVHPSSPSRLPVYNDYDWPPTVEYVIDVGIDETRLITTVDAIFRGSQKFGEGTLVVDWKSGSTKKSHPSQIQTYAYGLKAEGLFDPTAQLVIGAFHHIDHSTLQFEYDYWGDEIVESWIRNTNLTKSHKDITFNPDWWCGYCTARAKCPVMGDGDMQDIKIRLGKANRLVEPEGEAEE